MGTGEAVANPSCTMFLECTGFVTDTVGASVDLCGSCASGHGTDVQVRKQGGVETTQKTFTISQQDVSVTRRRN